jgi:hypothetical protein
MRSFSVHINNEISETNRHISLPRLSSNSDTYPLYLYLYFFLYLFLYLYLYLFLCCREFLACARRYNLPLGDFPDVNQYRKMLREVSRRSGVGVWVRADSQSMACIFDGKPVCGSWCD